MNTVDPSDKEIDQSKEAVRQDARELWHSLKPFFLELFDLPGRLPHGQLT